MRYDWWRRTLGGSLPLRGVRPPQKPRRLPLAMLVVLALFVAGVALFELRLRPVVVALAEAQAVSQFTAVIDQAILEDLSQRGTDYDDFVTTQRDSGGNIQSLTTNMAAMNLLRAQLEIRVYESVGEVELSTISIPLGSLFGTELLWGRGPSLETKALSIGILNSEFVSEFTQAGINQTRHRIYLDIQVPITLLIAGGTVHTQITTYLCVAETVIVGDVPTSYLQF